MITVCAHLDASVVDSNGVSLDGLDARGYINATEEYGKMVATAVCALIIFVIRVLATYFKWNMPKAIDFNAIRESVKNEDSRE